MELLDEPAGVVEILLRWEIWIIRPASTRLPQSARAGMPKQMASSGGNGGLCASGFGAGADGVGAVLVCT
jgi:hypothetical protein